MLQFQKILVISLPTRTDHRDALALGSAFTDLKLEYVDGVYGKDVDEKTLPPGAKDLNGLGNRGSWRGHLNAIHRVVAEGLESALIMEDDVDWDIRIKDQLIDFARGIHLLSQPLSLGRYADPTFPRPEQQDTSDPKNLFIGKGNEPTQPVKSPYGDNWDLLWPGHCGTRFPEKDRDPQLPRARAVLVNDITVPETQHIAVGWGNDLIKLQYPNHTRIVHHTAENVCSLVYAVTQRAARQILWKLSLDQLSGPIDISLRNYCDGQDKGRVRNCYTLQPPYFDHHRPIGSTSKYSDINEHDETPQEYNAKAHTYNIRWSMRMNLEKLVEGETNFADQYPDFT
jgi:hypothetical protein